jgi:hypothetical protein
MPFIPRLKSLGFSGIAYKILACSLNLYKKDEERGNEE